MTCSTEGTEPSEAINAVKGYTATTVPVHVGIAVDQVVLNLQEAEALLRKAGSIALGPCECRTDSRKHCDAPVDVCLTLDGASEVATESRAGFRTITVAEALAVLRLSHDAGLVHLAYRKPGMQATLFCSCCSCCCWFLGTLSRFDYHDAIVVSSHVTEHLLERCGGCGACVTRCPFGAWTRDSELPALLPGRCFGCGLCVSTCPAGAIAFVPRSSASPALTSP